MKEMRMYQHHPAFEEKAKPHLYKIGMFAGMNRVTIKTLRYYDEQKLLTPVYVDEENGYRYYEAGQIADLHRILALKNMGFSIEDIRCIVNGAEEKSLLLGKKQEILKKIAELTVRLAEVETYLAKDTLHLTAPVLIRKIPEVTVCTMKRRIESYDALFYLMPEMGDEMERLRNEEKETKNAPKANIKPHKALKRRNEEIQRNEIKARCICQCNERYANK